MVAELSALAAALVVLAAELIHLRRRRHLAVLAFGPRRRPALWTWAVPPLRVVAFAALAWGLLTLLLLPPKVHKINAIPENEYRDLVLVLDVSPSMRLADAGPKGTQTRRRRAADILQSAFERAPMEIYRTTIVAVYNGAIPVTLRTTDPEVVRNILEDLPMEYAFTVGGTDLLAGVKEAAKIAEPWRPNSTTLVIVSDGDIVPPTGMPRLPASISHVVVVGVGDEAKGSFIAGHLSRQDVSSLRQLAIRLNGTYHNGNEKHLPTDLVRQVTFAGGKSVVERLTRREYALIACAGGAGVLGVLPVLLFLAGTSWRPGVRSSGSVGGPSRGGR
jgi:Ca-activated chloride channel family protein